MGVILDTIDAIQRINGTIQGIKTAPLEPRYYPASMGEHLLPCAITIPGAGEWTRAGFAGPLRSDRTYTIRVFVVPENLGDFGPNIQRTIELIERFGAAYLNPENTALQNGYNQISLKTESDTDTMRDSGLMISLQSGNVRFYGFEFVVGVYGKDTTP